MTRRYKVPRDWRQQLAAAFNVALKRMEQIGSTVDAQLAWLHRFSEQDVSDDAVRVELAGEVGAMLMMRYRGWAAGSTNVAAELERTIEPDNVREIQQAIRELLSRLEPGQIVNLSSALGDGLVWREDRGIAVVTRSPGAPQVLAAVIDLLIEAGAKLQRCAGCGRLFAMSRPRQRYCSRQCGTRVRVAEWRAKNPERHTENRHQQYVRKVRARFPKARVNRKRKG